MAKLLINFYFIMCFGFLLLPESVPVDSLRIKRSDNASAADSVKIIAEKLPMPTPLQVDKPQAKIDNITPVEAAKAVGSNAVPVPLPVPFAAPVIIAEEFQPEFRAKRRMSVMDESLVPKAAGRHAHHHIGNAAPPYVYLNKMVSPDGRQELKEFQYLAPNMVIESLQHDMNYGPVPDMGGVLVLSSDGNPSGRLHGLAKSKHHHKHKSSPLSLPPFLYMLQQMLQPNLNMEMESPLPRNRIDTPIYQFIDSPVDNVLHENDNDKENDIPQKIELVKEDKSKETNELIPNRKDELIVSCPIHHEHISGNNGETIDDDVVLVNECHVV